MEKMKKYLLPIILCVVICVLVGVVVVLFLQQGTPAETNPPATQGVGGGVGLIVDPNANADGKLETEAQKVDGIAIPGWGALTIPAGQRENIIANFHNPAENAGKYYLTFELSLTNEDGSKGEVIYKSGLVEPGKYIQTITLNKALEAGTYDVNMFVQPYNMADKTPTNNMNSKMKLVVVEPKSAG